MSALSWRYAGLDFGLLQEADVLAVAEALDCPAVQRCLVYYGQPTVAAHLRVQAQRDLVERELCFVAHHEGRPLAMAGVLGYEDGMEAVTYVAPLARRRGVNTACKHMQVAVCERLGMPLYAGAKAWNAPSIASLRAHWPTVTPELVAGVSPNGRRYEAYTWRLSGPPVRGTRPTAAERASLRGLLEAVGAPTHLAGH